MVKMVNCVVCILITILKTGNKRKLVKHSIALKFICKVLKGIIKIAISYYTWKCIA